MIYCCWTGKNQPNHAFGMLSFQKFPQNKYLHLLHTAEAVCPKGNKDSLTPKGPPLRSECHPNYETFENSQTRVSLPWHFPWQLRFACTRAVQSSVHNATVPLCRKASISCCCALSMLRMYHPVMCYYLIQEIPDSRIQGRTSGTWRTQYCLDAPMAAWHGSPVTGESPW